MAIDLTRTHVKNTHALAPAIAGDVKTVSQQSLQVAAHSLYKDVIAILGYEEEDKHLFLMGYLIKHLTEKGYELPASLWEKGTLINLGDSEEAKVLSRALFILVNKCDPATLHEVQMHEILLTPSETREQLDKVASGLERVLVHFEIGQTNAFELALSDELFSPDLTIGEVLITINDLFLHNQEINARAKGVPDGLFNHIHTLLAPALKDFSKKPISEKDIANFKRFFCQSKEAKHFIDLLYAIREAAPNKFNLNMSYKCFLRAFQNASFEEGFSFDAEVAFEKQRQKGVPVFQCGALAESRREGRNIILRMYTNASIAFLRALYGYSFYMIKHARDMNTQILGYFKAHEELLGSALMAAKGVFDTFSESSDVAQVRRECLTLIQHLSDKKFGVQTLLKTIDNEMTALSKVADSFNSRRADTNDVTMSFVHMRSRFKKVESCIAKLPHEIDVFFERNSTEFVDVFFKKLLGMLEKQPSKPSKGSKSSKSEESHKTLREETQKTIQQLSANSKKVYANALRELQGYEAKMRHTAVSYSKYLQGATRVFYPSKPLGWVPDLQEIYELLDEPTSKEAVESPRKKPAAKQKKEPDVKELSDSMEDLTLDEHELDEQKRQFKEPASTPDPTHLVALTQLSAKEMHKNLLALIAEDHQDKRLLETKAQECQYHTELAMQNYQSLIECLEQGRSEEAPLYTHMLLVDMHIAAESYLMVQFAVNNPDEKLPKSHSLVELSKLSGIKKDAAMVRFFQQFDLANFIARFPIHTLEVIDTQCKKLPTALMQQSMLAPHEMTKHLEALSTHLQTLCSLTLPEQDYKQMTIEHLKAVSIPERVGASEAAASLDDPKQQKLQALVEKCEGILQDAEESSENMHLREAVSILRLVMIARLASYQATDDRLRFSHLRGEMLLEKALEQIFTYMHIKEHGFQFVTHDFEKYLETLKLPRAVLKKGDLLLQLNLGNAHHYLSLSSKGNPTHRHYKEMHAAQRQRMACLGDFEPKGLKPYPSLQKHDSNQDELLDILHIVLDACK